MTGFLFSIAVFLLAYRGIDWRDRVAGIAACVFAVGVALFPTEPPPPPNPTDIQKTISFFHFLFAALMFGALAFFSLYLFTNN